MCFREASTESTAEFRTLTHNRHLCPRTESQLQRVLDCFIKFRHAAYDVQGIHDRGTDVLLRYGTDAQLASDGWECICVQLKSFSDLEKDGYLKDLRSQRYEAELEYRSQLAQYYILLCTDPTGHIAKIREVKNAFARDARVTVVDPRYCHTFLRLGAVTIAVIVDSILRQGDTVRQMAINEVARLTPTESALALAATYCATFGHSTSIDIHDFKDLQFVMAMYSVVPDYPRDCFFEDDGDGFDCDEEVQEECVGKSVIADGPDAGDINSPNGEEAEDEDLTDEAIAESRHDRGRPMSERLNDDVSAIEDDILIANADSTFIVDLAAVRPLQAMLLDSHLRYRYEKEELLQYAFGCLRVLKRCDIDPMDGEPPLIS